MAIRDVNDNSVHDYREPTYTDNSDLVPANSFPNGGSSMAATNTVSPPPPFTAPGTPPGVTAPTSDYPDVEIPAAKDYHHGVK